MNKSINRLIKLYGTQAETARQIGVSKATVNSWVKGLNKVKPLTAKHIEEVTGGEIKRAELRPDLFQ